MTTLRIMSEQEIPEDTEEDTSSDDDVEPIIVDYSFGTAVLLFMESIIAMIVLDPSVSIIVVAMNIIIFVILVINFYY
jgi:hypothetical protein